MTNHIDKARISNTLYEISPSPDGILDNTKYVSNDKSNTTEYSNVDPITTTETNSSIFSKITTMISNIRYIWSRIGTTDISSIGDSITSALVNSNNNATTKADNNTYGQVKIGDGLIVQDGVISADFKTIFLNFAYPIGTIYESTNNVSPATFLGGTWEEYGSDRVLVGRGPDHSTGSTGGNRYISLSASNLPEHSHEMPSLNSGTIVMDHIHEVTVNLSAMDVEHERSEDLYHWTKSNSLSSIDQDGKIWTAGSSIKCSIDNSTYPTGSGRSFNIEQPYVTIYRWRRTA